MIKINNNQELWKEISLKHIKPHMYSISNFGNVRNNNTGTLLHPWKGNNGYRFVSLMCENNEVYKISIHVLVATYFVPIPHELVGQRIVPNHNDFNKENNHYTNLTWMTYAMNNEWNIIHGHCKHCENAPNSKSTNKLVHEICKCMEQGMLNREVVKYLGLDYNDYTKSLLTRIRNGSEWKSISSQYNIVIKNTLRQNEDDFVDRVCELIENDLTLKEMREILDIGEDKKSKEKFKKFVWFLRNRKTYKDISEKYSWWKK